MTTRKRILFLGEGVTLAHVVRPLALAQTLDSEFFEVYLGCAPMYESMVRSSGVNFLPLDTRTPGEFKAILDSGKELFSEETLLRYVRSDLELIDKVKPDLIVSDFRLSSTISAPARKVPLLSITNAYWSTRASLPDLPLPSYRILQRLRIQHLRRGVLAAGLRAVFGAALPLLFAYQLKGQNLLRRRFGLPEFSSYLEGFIFGDLTLFADTPLVAPVRSLEPNHRYIGALSWSPAIALPSWWNELEAGRPVVYLALGSSGVLDVVPQAIEVLRGLGAQVVVSTAGRPFPELGRGVFSADFLPGSEVSRRASVVISNGGSPTTYQALAEGTPVLGIGANMDQLVCMTNVERAGAGLLLRADCFSKHSFREAVSTLLTDTRYRERAAAVASEFQLYDTRDLFPAAVNELITGDQYGRVHDMQSLRISRLPR